MRFSPQLLVIAFLAFAFSGCVTKRTLTEDGDVIDQKYIWKLPWSEPDEF